jgi:hypothetical protein
MAGMCSKMVLVLVAALVLVASASAATTPSVAAMNLQAADVPGAKLVSEGSVKEAGFLSAYARGFAFSNPARGLIALQSETRLAASTAKASSFVAKVERTFRSSAGRKALVAVIAKQAKVKPKAIVLGKPHAVAGFDQGFEVAVSVGVKGARAYESLTYLRLDRVAVSMLEVSLHPIGAGTTLKYTNAILGHIGAELGPQVVTPPTVSGTAQQGQTLTATPGTWSAADATFTYQWQHCDSAGASCVDLAGATAQTYAVTATDVGTTLHVVVTATTRFGSATASSPQTAVVT